MDSEAIRAMQLKTEDISTQISNKGIWSDDALGNRIKAAEKLFSIVSNQTNPLTIFLNGEWGSGKTFFLKRFVAEYADSESHNKGCAIYFNSWEDDFIEDPLLAIISQLKSVVNEETFPLYDSVKKSAANCLIKLLFSSFKTIINHKIGINVDSISLEDFKLESDNLFELYDSMDASRRKLKEDIGKLALKTKEKTGLPLLFVIDELDRCRPTFAVELLERIKHLFSVPNIVFVFGVNKDQLIHSINAIYGEIDSFNYLNRFYDIEFSLPPSSPNTFIKNLWERYDIQAKMTFKNTNASPSFYIEELFEKICESNIITLRQIDTCVKTFAMLVLSNECQVVGWIYLVAVAVIFKVANRNLYDKFIAFEITITQLIEGIFPNQNYDELSSQKIEKIIQYFYSIWSNIPNNKSLVLLKNKVLRNENIIYHSSIMPNGLSSCTSSEILNFFKFLKYSDKYAISETTLRDVLSSIDNGIKYLI